MRLQKKYYSFPKTVDSNYCKPWLWLFILKLFFKAGSKLISSSRLAFRSVLFMSRQLRYFLRMCNTWLKPCSGKHVEGISGSDNLNFPQTFGKRSLHLIQKSDHPCLIKYGTGFIRPVAKF